MSGSFEDDMAVARETVAERDRLLAVNAELLEILECMVDEDDCSFDHHGYCQTHDWFFTEPKCPQIRAKHLLKADSDAFKTTMEKQS